MPNRPPVPAGISFLGLGGLALQAMHDLPKAKVWLAQDLFGGHDWNALLRSTDQCYAHTCRPDSGQTYNSSYCLLGKGSPGLNCWDLSRSLSSSQPAPLPQAFRLLVLPRSVFSDPFPTTPHACKAFYCGWKATNGNLADYALLPHNGNI